MPAPAVTSGVSLRHRLRSATAAAHSRIDAKFGHLDLQSRPDYRRFLQASASALLPLEAALIDAGVMQVFPDWASRSRRHAILDDLAELDGEIAPLPAPDRLDFGALLGAMYVLEGSRLGAGQLLKTVRQSADPTVRQATAYLGHGAGEPLWPTFLTTLETHAASLPDDADAVRGANQAFALFERAATA